MIDHHPVSVLFSIAGINFYTWGVIFVASFLVALFLAYKPVTKKIGEKHFFNIAVLLLLGIIIGTRLLYVFINFNYFAQDLTRIFAFSEGGSSSFGGFLSVLFVWLYIRKHKINFRELLDSFAPYVALGLALGRIGCFLNWCCYGLETNLPWAITVNGVSRHPTQLYLLIANLIVFFVLLHLTHKRDKENNPRSILNIKGTIFLFFLLYYCLNRFFIDFLRYYVSKEFFLGLVLPQWICLVVMIVVTIVLIITKRKLIK
ncbi:MAG: prolipoprotein diacylglyceryl transferase [archaeon]|nr:MAG: prolipoprotein diacylglyceryl transferase [archaeon]